MDRPTIKRVLTSIEPKKIIAFIFLFIILFVTSNNVESRKDEKNIELLNLQQKVNFVKDLLSNKEKLDFISHHLFHGKSNDFIEFIRNFSDEKHINIINISCLEKKNLNNLENLKIKIDGFYWHDSAIFDLIDKIRSFSPGFVKIESIEIHKIAKISTVKPSIKAEIICEIFKLK